MCVMESLLLIVFLLSWIRVFVFLLSLIRVLVFARPSLIRVFVFARPGQEGQGTSSGQEGKVEEASITQTGLGPRSHTMN